MFALAVASSVACLTACDNDQKPSTTATLLNSGDVQDALKGLSSAIDSLESEVGNFETEDWKEVVPEVNNAATEVRDAFDRLRRALGVTET